MDQDRFQRLKQHFLAVKDLSPAERVRWFDREGLDAEYRAEVEALLRDHDSSTIGNVGLETPAFELAGLTQSPAEQLVGTSIGPFRLEGVIGQGGMGVVYRATQAEPEREVALKLIRGALDPESLRRHELEARALARLKHPGIVPLYEQGVTPDGTPWFAMQYVEGEPLDTFVSRHGLSIESTLRLFLELCHAVGYAHTKGIVHRDLKPANVLVCDHGTSSETERSHTWLGYLRVLDFGLARWQGPEQSLATRLTEPGRVMGTLAYMSPEQARSHDVDQRSDVYALGAILYELTTGRKPIDLQGCWVGEAMERITMQEPARPRSLSTSIDSDLQTIILKAIEKAPARRYQSVEELSEDLSRRLLHLPILAHAPSLTYQLRKLAGRHRTLTAVAVILLLFVSSAGLVFAWSEARHVSVLEEERDLARTVVRFQDRLFGADGADADPEIKVFELLDRAAAEVGRAFPDRPLLEADVRVTLGATYLILGMYDASEPLLREALAIRNGLLGRDQVDSLEAQHYFGLLLMERGRLTESIEVFREVLRIREQLFGADHEDVLMDAMQVGGTLLAAGQVDEAEPLVRRAYEGLNALKGADHPRTLETVGVLGHLLSLQGQLDQAEQILREALPRMRRVLGEDARVTRTTGSFLVRLLFGRGDWQQAETLQRDLIDASSRILGENHAWTLLGRVNLAQILANQGQGAASAEIWADVLMRQEHTLGPDHPGTIETMNRLAHLLIRSPRSREALELFRQAVERTTRAFGAEDPRTLKARFDLAQMTIALGDAAPGLEDLIEVAQDYLDLLGEEHPATLFAVGNAAWVMLDHDLDAEAEELLQLVVPNAVQVLGPEHADTQWARYYLAAVLCKGQRYEEALMQYEALLELPDASIPRQDNLWLLLMLDTAACLEALDRSDEAETHLRTHYDSNREGLGPEDDATRELGQALLRHYEMHEQSEAASRLRTELGE